MQDKSVTGEFLRGFVFTNIFRTFGFAIQPSKLIIALFAVAVLFLAGILMDAAQTMIRTPGPANETMVAMPGLEPPGTGQDVWRHCERVSRDAGVFATFWHFCAGRFDSLALSLATVHLNEAVADVTMIAGAIWWAARCHTLYTAIYLAVALVVMGTAGGAICRSAALQLARGEKPGLMESLRFSVRRLSDLATSPLWAVGVIVLIGLGLFAIGLLGNIPFGIGPVLIGLLSPLALLMGFVVALVILGLAGGASLIFPAVAYEGSDGIDALGRAIGYVYMRPWRTVFYAAVTLFYGALCYLFVRIFVHLAVLAAHAFVTPGIFTYCQQASTPDGHAIRTADAIWPASALDSVLGAVPQQLTPAESLGAILVRIPHLILGGLVAAFLVSFFFSASTVIYALLRKHVDGEAFDRIFTQVETLPDDNNDAAGDTVDTQ